MDKILDRLYLGCIADYRSGELEENGITAILCLSPEFWRTLREGGCFGDRKRVLVDINDGETPEGHRIDSALNVLKKWSDNNETIFVHCAAGISRSPSMVILHLIKNLGMFDMWEQAEDFVWAKRNVILPHPYIKLFMKQHYKLWPHDGSFDKYEKSVDTTTSTSVGDHGEEPLPSDNNDPSADA